jgi:predicted amidohydrolase
MGCCDLTEIDAFSIESAIAYQIPSSQKMKRGSRMERHARVIVAAAQCASEPFDPSRNLDRAAQFVVEARSRGAQLLVLPELFTTGYLEHSRLHDCAEELSGHTVCTLRMLSRDHSMHLACGFAERRGGHVYNSLAFCTPAGNVAVYRKRHLIFWEHYYFRPGDKPLIVETTLGRIGFAICADMLYGPVWEEYQQKIDLAVICSAWPIACANSTRRVAWLLTPSRRLAQEIPVKVSSQLSIPTVFSNHVGPCRLRVPMMGSESAAQFPGHAVVCDGDVGKLSSDVNGEGLAVASVSLPTEKSEWLTLSA